MPEPRLMDGAPSLSLLLAASALQVVLIVVLAVLGALVVLALLGGLVMFLRQRPPDESEATVESTPPAPQVSAPGAFGDVLSSPPPVPPPPVIGPQPPAPEPPGAVESGAGPVAPPPPAAVEPSDRVPAPLAGQEAVADGGAPAPISPTQTPDDVDQRSPSELAAAAQAAEAAQGRVAGAENGSGPAGALQHEGAIGPPRPLPLARKGSPDPARLRMLGLTLGILTERMRREHPPQLGTALARLVETDQEAARSQLSTLALSLLGEDEEPSAGDGQLSLFLEEALDGEVARGFAFSSMPEFQQALTAVAPELHEKLRTIVWARNSDSVAILTSEDVEALERVAVAMATALLIDTSYDLRRLPDRSPSSRA